ncbi:dTMP kinase [uncultured Corynebacterium sp.]|uniref:dTMP kinase n=1 Tax=uncultured Corynebacterium sp. TaxID=159447 RepID=UPI002592A9BA|nr:dTMP kinase [uncultured Corynebacterium sp.]
MIIAFEGVDGAGKNTLVTAVEQELISREVAVAKLGFPRYEHSIPAQLAQSALHQKMGDLTESIHGMATLFALDRHDVADDLSELDGDGYVILLDRYTASNAAYSAARSAQRESAQRENAAGESSATAVDARLSEHDVVNWVASLEFGMLGVPVPDLQVLVDVDAEVAAERAVKRELGDASRARDAYETDNDLQQLTVRAYRELAQSNWRSPWHVVDAAQGETLLLAEEIADLICRELKVD